MNQVLPFALRNSTMLKPVNVDISQCREVQVLQRDPVGCATWCLGCHAMGFQGPQKLLWSTLALAQCPNCLISFHANVLCTYSAQPMIPSHRLFRVVGVLIHTNGACRYFDCAWRRQQTLLSVSFRDVIGPMVFDPCKGSSQRKRRRQVIPCTGKQRHQIVVRLGAWRHTSGQRPGVCTRRYGRTGFYPSFQVLWIYPRASWRSVHDTGKVKTLALQHDRAACSYRRMNGRPLVLLGAWRSVTQMRELSTRC